MEQVILNEQEWNYEVAIKDLKTVDDNGQILGRQKATVDVSTGSILGVVSPYYNLVQNKTLFDTMKEIGEDLDLNIQSISVCKNRSMTILKYGFGEKNNKEVEGSTEKNDKIKFGIEVINSFDSRYGSSKFRAFAERLVCLNGMTLPRDIASFSFSSLKGGFNRNRFQAELTNRVTPIVNTANIWSTWTKITPSRIKVGEFISGNLGKGASELILGKYDAGSDKSIWSLYNLITYYITHELEVDNPRDLRYRQYGLERVADKFYTEDLI
jgi:hypothetical protein